MDTGINLFGKFLIGAGIFFILLGLFFVLGARINWFGRLPGDIFIQKKNFSFYFPLTTCLLLSILFTLIFWFVSRIRK